MQHGYIFVMVSLFWHYSAEMNTDDIQTLYNRVRGIVWRCYRNKQSDDLEGNWLWIIVFQAAIQ